jgi:hypothetical protein
MSDHIFNPASRFNSKQIDSENESEFYTIVGLEEFLDDNNTPRLSSESESAFAKKTIRKDGSIKYTLKLSTNGKLYNPVSMYGKEQETTFLNRVCRSNNKFVEVNQKVFDWYVQFLKTKNTAWLNNAERERE